MEKRMIDTYELIAPCHFGLESVLKREIYDLGYDIVKVEDGKVTLNSTSSYIAFDLDFGSETAKSITAYLKEPNNSGQLFVRIGSLTSSPARIYNLGNGSWKEINTRLWPTVTGKTKIYIQTNKPGLQIDWIQFGK